MDIKVTGATADGTRFEFERDLPGVPGLGETVEYDGARYVVEASSVDTEGGEIVGGACQLRPLGIVIDPARCPKTTFFANRLVQCENAPDHTGLCTFR